MKALYIALICHLFAAKISSAITHSDLSQFENSGYGNENYLTNGESLLLQGILSPESVVFDVGANSGKWSEVARQIEPKIQLYCFEPIPRQYQRLIERFRGIPSISAYKTALSDHTGKTVFYYFEDDGSSELSSLFCRDYFLSRNYKIMEVNLETLDHFCDIHQIPKIDFLKIDTEGNELNVLKGSKRMLSNHQIQSLQFEYGGTYPDAKITLYEVVKFLTEAGYCLFRISPSGLIHISRWDAALENGQYANYFAILQSEVPDHGLVLFPK